MRTAKIVIGSGYGDEGKGLMTDYFCSKVDEPGEALVVRYNGGAQAGHTVVTPNRKRHVFSHLGAGSLLGISTYLGADFIVNPIMFNIEFKQIERPTVLINPEARVTTPHDMLANQFIENARKQRHGSCGLGIFETIRRDKTLHMPVLKLAKLTTQELREYLASIKTYYYSRFTENGIVLNSEQKAIMELDILSAFQENVDQMSNRVLYVRPEGLVHFKSLIFEGAQGLLLSERHGLLPHLTPSDPGIIEPLNMCSALGIQYVDAVYVTRAYTTRHGAGPMRNECTANVLGIKGTLTETNTTNEFQEHLRYSPFDPACAEASVKDFDRGLNNYPSMNLKKQLAVTCIDQLRDFTRDRVRRMFHQYEARSGYVSTGPTRDNVNQFDLGSMG
jgi:adenylosuccinate synthase